MAATYIIDGAIISTVVYDEVELVETAEHGAVGTGSILIDDTAGTQVVTGHKSFSATESACGDPYTVAGFVGQRTYERGVAEASNARQIRVQVLDLNDVLSHRAISGSDGKRPTETVSARVSWLLSSDYLSGLVSAGRVQTSTEKMDKNDVRNSFPGDVLADCAMAAGGWNYYVYQDPTDGTARLAFRDDNASSSNTSALRISNVSVSIGSNTFAPMDDATLSRDPENVFARALVPYARGTVVEDRAATASNFAWRDGVAPNSNVKTAAAAKKLGRTFLQQHSTEEDVIECEIEVPAGAVNLAHAGDVISAQFGHWGPEGYSGFTNFRILERRVKPLVRDEPPAVYRVGLRLSPQEAGPVTCSFPATPSTVFYPLGGSGNIPNKTSGGGNVIYVRPGFYYPVRPTVNYQGSWHFPRYSSGGAGTIDYGGDCVQNVLRFIVSGPGTLVIKTEIYGGSTRGFDVARFGAYDNGVSHHWTYVGRYTSGNTVTVQVNDTTAPSDCVRIIDLYGWGGQNKGGCGGAMGWSSAVWTSTA